MKNMKKCLVVIDMQNDFISGSLGTPEAKIIVPRVVKRIENAVKENEDIFFTKDTHYENYLETNEGKNLPILHCIENTEGHQICDELTTFMNRAKGIFIKNTFGYKELPRHLSDYDEITFVGLCTDICVISNVLLVKAFYPEKNIIVEKDLCAGVTPEKHKEAVSVMQSCHIKVI